jgi:hypothetical protein
LDCGVARRHAGRHGVFPVSRVCVWALQAVAYALVVVSPSSRLISLYVYLRCDAVPSFLPVV